MNELTSYGWKLVINQKILNDFESDDYILSSRCIIDDSCHVRRTKDVFLNKSTEDIEINCLLNQFLLREEIVKVIYQKSAWCHENQTAEEKEVDGFRLKSNHTRTTQEMNPFLIVITETMTHAIHILPVGDWEIGIKKAEGNESHYVIFAGINSDDLKMIVKPGQSINLPECMIQSSDKKNIRENAMHFHQYLNTAFKKEDKHIPVVYNSWFYDFDKFTVENLKMQVKAAKELGIEAFVVDAGWYGPSNDDWYKATGDWREKTDGAFYGKMKQFSDHVISEGLSFGLWIEPERICKGVPVLDDHPDYFTKSDEDHYYHDLMKPEAREFFFKTVSDLIEKYQVSWLKIDYNFPLLNDPYDSHFYYYMSYLYQTLGKLREKYPDVVFEGCESGAMRFDLNSCQYYDVHFLSDNVNPVDALSIYTGSLLRMSPASIYKWVVIREIEGIPQYTIPIGHARRRLVTPKGATWEQFESTEGSFVCALAISGYPGFSGDLASLTGENRKTLMKFIDIYKENREIIKNCHAYVYEDELSPDSIGWKAYQLCDKNEMKRIVFCYRLDSPSDKCLMKLKDFDASKSYIMKGSEIDETVVQGKELSNGLAFYLKNRQTAVIVSLETI